MNEPADALASYQTEFDQKTAALREKSAKVAAESLRTLAGSVLAAGRRFFVETPHSALLVALTEEERHGVTARIEELRVFLVDLAGELQNPIPRGVPEEDPIPHPGKPVRPDTERERRAERGVG